MSDTESSAPPAHVTLGGKSLAAIERPRYKSWRKKFRKMRTKFDGVLEENKRLFKEEQKLTGIARRLKEELDALLELCLDLNRSPALPPNLRFDISLPREHTAVDSIPSVVAADIQPDDANALYLEYTVAVQRGQIPHLDLHVIREQIDKRLAAQDVLSLAALEARVPHAVPGPAVALPDGLPLDVEPRASHAAAEQQQQQQQQLPDGSSAIPAASLLLLLGDGKIDDAPGFLTSEQEDAYLARQDGKAGILDPLQQPQVPATAPVSGRGGDPATPAAGGKQKDTAAATGGAATTTSTGTSAEEKPWAEFTPREADRQTELQNPQSQHSWLKAHAKQSGGTVVGVEIDDTESVASHETTGGAGAGGGVGGGSGNGSGGSGNTSGGKSAAAGGTKNGAKRNLARQVGDRALERAREGMSPSAHSAGFADEDDVPFVDEQPSGGSKKRAKADVDGTYRVKGGKASAGAGRGKRKRATGGEDHGTAKKAKTESTAE